MLKDGKCDFREKCWYCHDKAVLEAAQKGKSKTFCKFFQQGSCKKGDKCDFSHELPEQNGTGDIAIGSVAVSVVAQQVLDGSDELELVQPLAETSLAEPNVRNEVEDNHRNLSEEECAEYVLAAHLATHQTQENEIDQFLKEIEAGKLLEEEVAKVLKGDRQARGSVAEATSTVYSGSKQKKKRNGRGNERVDLQGGSPNN